jgi:hypothetical protein
MIRCCESCDDQGHICLPDTNDLAVVFEKPGCNPNGLRTEHLVAINADGSHHALVCPHGSDRRDDLREEPSRRLSLLMSEGFGVVGRDAYLAHNRDPDAAARATEQWLHAKRDWEADVQQWLYAKRKWETDVQRWLQAKHDHETETQARADCQLCDADGWVKHDEHNTPVALILRGTDGAAQLVKTGAAKLFGIDLLDGERITFLKLICGHDVDAEIAKIGQLGDDYHSLDTVENLLIHATTHNENVVAARERGADDEETSPFDFLGFEDNEEPDDDTPDIAGYDDTPDIAGCPLCDSEGNLVDGNYRRIVYIAPDGWDLNDWEVSLTTTGFLCEHDRKKNLEVFAALEEDGFVRKLDAAW